MVKADVTNKKTTTKKYIVTCWVAAQLTTVTQSHMPMIELRHAQ